MLEVEEIYIQSFHHLIDAVIRFNALDETIDLGTEFSD